MADTSSITKKLLAFQSKGIKIEKSSTNPAFKSKYADLSEVLGKVQPALTECGILLIQLPTADGLMTILRDPEGGDEIHCTIPLLDTSTPQRMGSSITYARRYALVSMLGLGDDDDDGNEASISTKPAAPAKPAMTPEQAMATLRATTTIDALVKAFKSLPAAMQTDPEVVATGAEVKQLINNQ